MSRATLATAVAEAREEILLALADLADALRSTRDWHRPGSLIYESIPVRVAEVQAARRILRAAWREQTRPRGACPACGRQVSYRDGSAGRVYRGHRCPHDRWCYGQASDCCGVARSLPCSVPEDTDHA